MIQLDTKEDALRCTLCGEQSGISKRAQGNKTRRKMLTRFMETEHAGCARYADDPAMAKAERQYQAGMRALICKRF